MLVSSASHSLHSQVPLWYGSVPHCLPSRLWDRNIISRNFNRRIMSLWLFVACICRKPFSIQSQHVFLSLCHSCFLLCSTVVFKHMQSGPKRSVSHYHSTSFYIKWLHWFAQIQPESETHQWNIRKRGSFWVEACCSWVCWRIAENHRCSVVFWDM